MLIHGTATVWDHVGYKDTQLDAALFTENEFKGPPTPAEGRGVGVDCRESAFRLLSPCQFRQFCSACICARGSEYIVA